MRALPVIAFLFVFALTGCRASQAPDTAQDVTITVNITETPQKVGQFALMVTLLDAAQNPINGAKIDVTGDMTHAGMVPVKGTAEGGASGLYAVPFQWTMSGDWIVTVRATLPDGRIATRRFEVRVSNP